MTPIKMERVWAMPCAETFSIPPIAALLAEEVGKEQLWVDPFARNNKWGNITNDLNPETAAQYHDDAYDFLNRLEKDSADGILFDPPYSAHQIVRTYEGYGSCEGSKRGIVASVLKDLIAGIVKPGGKVICFGFHSNGMGKKREFSIMRLLLVAHGGEHNDTIVTVWEKSKEQQQSLNFQKNPFSP